ncbi:MAG TPA: rod shape-determining protein MreD [Candidatus Nanoarchaeia archaeon]|nr:rod shape-determining protein MreD [Candidatus Nanoarchaeia archaeon]
MSNLKLLLITLVAAWLQLYFLGNMRPLGVLPNLLIIVIIYAGLLREATETLAIALGGGLILDLASGADFGLRMAFYAVLALVVMVLRQMGADFENLGLVLATTAVGAFLYNLAVITGLALQHGSVPLSLAAGRIGRELLLDLVLVVLLRPLLIKILQMPATAPKVMGG